MAAHQMETEGFSIMVLGAFNPTIFQPLWFSTHNLIRSEEAETADIEIIHRHAAVFRTEWLSLQVTDKNLTIVTEDPTMSLPHWHVQVIGTHTTDCLWV